MQVLVLLVIKFGLHCPMCDYVPYEENRTWMNGMRTHRQTDRQTERQTNSDFISVQCNGVGHGTDNKRNTIVCRGAAQWTAVADC